MKTLGRVFLIIVGALMVVSAVLTIVGSVARLNGIGWELTNPNGVAYLLYFIFSFIDLAFGLSAFLGGIKGKASLLLIIFSIILLASAIVELVMSITSGMFASPDATIILGCVLNFVFPALFFMATMFVRKGR